MYENNPELKVLRETPEKYASIARQVDLAMTLSSRPCAGGECDEGCPCGRHGRILDVVSRYIRIKNRR